MPFASMKSASEPATMVLLLASAAFLRSAIPLRASALDESADSTFWYKPIAFEASPFLRAASASRKVEFTSTLGRVSTTAAMGRLTGGVLLVTGGGLLLWATTAGVLADCAIWFIWLMRERGSPGPSPFTDA